MKKFLVFLLLLPALAGAQVRYPVVVAGFVVQPRIFLSDYLLSGSNNIRAGLLFVDLHEPSREVFLRLTVESATAKLESHPQAIFTPITLYPGELLQLADADFAEYFRLENLQLRGVDRATVARSGRLPEGFYTLTLQVCDYRSREVISNAAKYSVRLQLTPPPTLIYPRRGAVVSCEAVQHIFFQWQLNSPDVNAMNTSYTLALYEVSSEAQHPEVAIANGQAMQVYASDPAPALSLLYSAFEPLLTCGRRYAYTVTAADAEGRDVFKNGGASEVGWFYFGYPEGGTIPLSYPPNGGAFAISSRKALRWGGSDKFLPDQPVRYTVRVVAIGDEEEASEQSMAKAPFWEVSTGESRRQQEEGGSAELLGLDAAQRYAWQVEAFTGGQAVARSAVHSFYGAPLLEEFYAGVHRVVVASARGSLGKLAGVGSVMLGKGGEMYDIPFKDASVSSPNGVYVLQNAITLPVPPGFGSITLTPEDARNGEATFTPDSLRISPDGLSLHGSIAWAYPFAVDGREKPWVRSRPFWGNFNDLTLSGAAGLSSGNDFALMEPGGFTMELSEDSRFIFNENRYRLQLCGSLLAPAGVKGVKEEAYRLHFSGLEQLYYNAVQGYACKNKVSVVPNADLWLHPTEFTIDLDDGRSPGKYSESPEWRGVYYNAFTVEYPATLDHARQVVPLRPIAHRFSEADSSAACLQAGGLTLHLYDRLFAEAAEAEEEGAEVAEFNAFPSSLTALELAVEGGRVKGGSLKGSIRLPFVSQTRRYQYTAPISGLGFQPGYLDQPLEGTTFDHNPDGGEQRITVTVRRAVFANRNRLEMSVDMAYHFLGVTFEGLQGLSLWGRGYEVGFGAPNGAVALTRQQTAVVKGFETTFDHLGAGRNGNLYAVGVSGKMNMGEDVTGVGGPPVVNFYSTVENSLLDGAPAEGGSLYENTPLAGSDGEGYAPPQSDVGAVPPGGAEEVVSDQRIPAFEEHSAQLDALSKIAQEKVEVDTARKPMFAEVDEAAVTTEKEAFVSFEQLEQAMDVIIDIAKLIGNEKVARWGNSTKGLLDVVRQVMSKEELQQFISQIEGPDKLKALILKQAVDYTIAKIKDPIEQQERKVQAFVSAKISGLADTAMTPAIKLMNEAFEKARPSLVALSPSDSAQISRAITAAKKSITESIDKAVKNAVSAEITGSINAFIHTAIAGRIYGMVDSAVGKSLYQVAEGKKPDMDKIGSDISAALEGMGGDVAKFVSLDNIGHMLGNTAKAAWNNVDMLKIVGDITTGLLGESLEKYVADKLEKGAAALASEVFGDNPPKLPGSVSASVKMDFNAIRQGDFKNAVSFDPSSIVIKSPVADVSGYVKFVENDPVWGQSWQAMLNAVVHVPKDFSAYALYINGSKARASADEGAFKFWILDVGVSGLGITLTPLPVKFNSAKGKVYQHVQRDPATDTYAPSEAVRFGLNFDAGFTDAGGGKIVFFDVGMGASIMDKGFMLEIYGKVDAANKVSDAGELQKSLITGTGRFTYNSIDGAFLGRSSVKTNTDPLICCSGDMDLAITRDNFAFSLGTREQPVMLDVLCRSKPQLAGWFALSDQRLDMGAFVDIDVTLETGWIGGRCVRIKPWLRFMFKSGFTTLVYWDPFKIAEAGIWLDMYAGVGVQYDFCLKSGNFIIADVGMGGLLRYVADPSSELSGNMHGSVHVLGVGFNVNFDVKVNL
jgi:hypothetical protein